MPSTADDPLQTPQDTEAEVSAGRSPKITTKDDAETPVTSPIASVAGLPYKRANASLSHLFQSTTSLPSTAGSDSGAATPTTGAVNGSVFSPGTTIRVGSPAPSTTHSSGAVRDLILKAFAPHVSVLASQDAEELVRHKGIDGGLLELLRPFGEHVQGKVTIRDSSGASLSWDDYAIRFTGVKDGLESPRGSERQSADIDADGHRRVSSLEYKPARLRSGGDVLQIEEVVERHLTYAEEHSGPITTDYLTHKDTPRQRSAQMDSPFYLLYLKRLLSGMPMVPSESLSHPVATVIAISSRSKAPIEELRNLFASSNSGDDRLPPWVLNEFLRYYILIHDEDYDDIQKSMTLFDQMKRHFGLHCHLLRLRSTQCLPSDDDSVRLPACEWTSAAEELHEIVRRESNDDDDAESDPTPYIFESDATAIRAFVREMVTQSVVPSMERASATWNDQVASKRRGLTGRFMSLSKRITTFGGRAATPSITSSGSNYDSAQGFYRPDAAEAIMRRLADYSLMLRDFKLAQSTFEILCSDYKNDRAWRYYAGANEMAATSALLAMGSGLSTKARTEAIDQYLETAHYSYITRVGSPYHALRSLLLGVELLKPRNGSASDDAARWLSRVLEDRLVGPTGHALILERIALCYVERRGVGGAHTGQRRRKAAFWYTLAGEAWLRQEKTGQAEKCILEAARLYELDTTQVGFHGIERFLLQLQAAIKDTREGPKPFDGPVPDLHLDTVAEGEVETIVEDQPAPRSPLQTHKKSLSIVSGRSSEIPGAAATAYDPLGAITMLPNSSKANVRDDGFE